MRVKDIRYRNKLSVYKEEGNEERDYGKNRGRWEVKIVDTR